MGTHPAVPWFSLASCRQASAPKFECSYAQALRPGLIKPIEPSTENGSFDLTTISLPTTCVNTGVHSIQHSASRSNHSTPEHQSSYSFCATHVLRHGTCRKSSRFPRKRLGLPPDSADGKSSRPEPAAGYGAGTELKGPQEDPPPPTGCRKMGSGHFLFPARPGFRRLGSAALPPKHSGAAGLRRPLAPFDHTAAPTRVPNAGRLLHQPRLLRKKPFRLRRAPPPSRHSG